MSREQALSIAFGRVAEMYTARNKGTVTTHPAITPKRVYQTPTSAPRPGRAGGRP
jgi:hypothetical protein